MQIRVYILYILQSTGKCMKSQLEGAKRARIILKDNLPHDTFMDILSRLPTKSLCRFRCISKHWCNTISDPDFVKLYNDQSHKRNNPLLLFYDRDPRDNPIEDDDYYFGCCMGYGEDYSESNDEERPTKIETSHYLITTMADGNGRVCDKFKFWCFEGHTDDVTVIPSGHELVFLMRGIGEIYVCNPSTHEQVELPWPPWVYGCNEEEEGRFVLTFVPSTGDYKLLHLVNGRDNYNDFRMQTCCRVYDITKDGKSGCGEWRCLYSCDSGGLGSSMFPDYCCDQWELDIVSNTDGAVYWWMNYSDDNYIGPEGKFESIISLNMERDEDFLIIEKPEECSLPFSSSVYLVGLRGQLSLIHMPVDGTLAMDIWMLKDPRNSIWAKEYSFKTPFKKFYYAMPLHVGQREILLRMLLMNSKPPGDQRETLMRILFRNSKPSVLRKYPLGRKSLRDHGDFASAYYKTGPFIYTEGLFRLGRSQI